MYPMSSPCEPVRLSAQQKSFTRPLALTPSRPRAPLHRRSGIVKTVR